MSHSVCKCCGRYYYTGSCLSCGGPTCVERCGLCAVHCTCGDYVREDLQEAELLGLIHFVSNSILCKHEDSYLKCLICVDELEPNELRLLGRHRRAVEKEDMAEELAKKAELKKLDSLI